ncbi:hypothetical protein TNCV_3652071 [Trichonephila clavipes]|uniref:Uncharacterized protein n=1 Tax=Trichonephila clavipes TaxID=2585209 RepID=A0A8X6S845_TRICX|nr:hypothetical protein TNCV_3652071 [Trichonephila clavipes]
MWFRLALNTSTPSVQILIGEKVDIKGFFSILQGENAVMRDLFLKALTYRYAHQTGMRMITDKFKKGPTLTVVDTRDAKSVFIPEWVHRFKLDVKKVRREVKYPFFESP